MLLSNVHFQRENLMTTLTVEQKKELLSLVSNSAVEGVLAINVIEIIISEYIKEKQLQFPIGYTVKYPKNGGFVVTVYTVEEVTFSGVVI